MSRNLDLKNEKLKIGSQIFYISCYAEKDKERFVKEFIATDFLACSEAVVDFFVQGADPKREDRGHA